MRIHCDSPDGGKPFEVFNADDNGLDVPGWYYMPLMPIDDQGGFEPLDDAPTGPFTTPGDAFNDAYNCNFK